MRLAYIILTHGMPDHLGRMIAALHDEWTDFYVHVDRKVDIGPFLDHRAANVHFAERRLPVYWGQWQMVEATLGLMRDALDQRPYDYLLLLSGSCYPIRSRRRIRALLEGRRGDEFINSVRMPNARAGKSLARLERYAPRHDLPRLETARRLVALPRTWPREGRRLSKRWLLSRDWRQAFGSFVPHGGSSWWALTAEACRHIDDVARREVALVRFLENTRSPDEVFFQTILANSSFAPRMRRTLTYADWSGGGAHPAVLSDEHLLLFAQDGPATGVGAHGRAERCFARKFPDDGGRLAGLVDDLVRRRESTEGAS